MDLGKIEHSHLLVRGLNLHIAQIGTGQLGTVIFLHDFLEIWYTWRYQMLAVAHAGFRAVAPDFRGYGLSDQPPEPEKASFDDLVDDLLRILDALGVPKAFLVGKDFGAFPAYDFAVKHPDRVQGVVNRGIPYSPTAFDSKPLPEGFYIYRWREPGRAEADFGRISATAVVRNVYILFSKSEIPIAAEGQEIMDLADHPISDIGGADAGGGSHNSPSDAADHGREGLRVEDSGDGGVREE
ncbi:Proline iminopeptidase [Platanthera guangdongensis]|uniref:Proline iminopeptidase n=1 Tax=Platanthera guangdongensis TaxID=2320717 RepID=A0ABR2LNN5_9ASPA